MPKIKVWKDSSWVTADANNGDTVDGLHFRINASKLQYSTDGSVWVDAGTNTSDATALASDVLAGKTVYVNGVKITGTITSKGAQTYTPSTANQTIASGQYLSGTQTIEGDADLVSANIRAGVNIFGVNGATAVINTAGYNATAGAILTGYSAGVQGATVNGTIPVRTGDTAATAQTANGSGDVILTPAAGYYSGTSRSFAYDPDFVAGNIKSGVNIFGVTGTAPVAKRVLTGSFTFTYGDQITYISTGGWIAGTIKAWASNGNSSVQVMLPGSAVTPQTYNGSAGEAQTQPYIGPGQAGVSSNILIQIGTLYGTGIINYEFTEL